MQRKKWNDSWVVADPSASPLMAMVSGDKQVGRPVYLPHDAMIHEKRTKDTANAHQTGFYPGNVYTYTKRFQVQEDWQSKTVLFEFEGVYMNARIYINGDYAGGHPYGYTNFYVCADDYLKYGVENEIKVIANNSGELNSRWYSGSGIYRNVNILIGNAVHIKEDSVRVSTPEISDTEAVVMVDTVIKNQGVERKKVNLLTQIRNQEGKVIAEDQIPVTLFGSKLVSCRQRILVDTPNLWDTEHPHLYTYKVKVIEEDQEDQDTILDEESGHFGVRRISLDPKHGFRLNGRTVNLRGACIHHDNGIIGACTLERAEERRCQQLKAAGFNCIRSSHHPMSKAMLDACDREGVLVLDELSDVWTRSKNHNDYAQVFSEYWEKDVEQMIEKDFNHPSVIMYVTGNEIQEAGTAKGAELNRAITAKIRSMDSTRYITCALNGLLAAMDRMGEIMSAVTGKTPEELFAASQKSNNVGKDNSDAGSDGLNSAMGMLMGPMADAMAASPVMTEILSEITGTMDVAGYNYLTGRHELDHNLNANRIVLGTETFPSDIARLWKIVKENGHVIGDMTWTGYDYLGEAGIGIFYYDGRMGFSANWPSSVAYIGDIDIIGYRRPISYYREIVFGLRQNPYISVDRLNHYGEKPNQTAWMWKDDIANWTWKDYEGKPAVVNVFAAGDEVELFLNGMPLGRKPVGEDHDYIAVYEILYEPGELMAVSYQDGRQIGTYKLVSASEAVDLDVLPDRSEIKADGADLSYILVSLIDKQGNRNLQIKKEITITVEGSGTLQGFGSADPETENSYDNLVWETYDGYVLAVVRAGTEEGEIKVTFSADGCESKTVAVQTRK